MIREVTMHRAICDVCGKGDDGDDYYAWADDGQALDSWSDSDVGPIVFTEGICVHWRCVPSEQCPELDEGECHTFDGDGDCGEGCGRRVRDLLAPAAGAEVSS